MNEAYSRQSMIPGWQQEKLKQAYVAVVGGNLSSGLTAFLAGGLTAFGVGKVLLTGERTGDASIFGFNGTLENYLSALNPEVSVAGNYARLSNPQITNKVFRKANRIPNVIIDASNNPYSSYSCLNYGLENSIPVFIAASGYSGFLFLRSINEKKRLADAERMVEEASIFRSEQEGKTNSMTLAALVLDETRKALMPIKGDVESEDLRYKNVDYPVFLDKNILMVGAGAIGTFTGLGIALNGVKKLFVGDFDRIEAGNLGSQILYYSFDRQKDQKKASVLCSRLEKVSEKYCFSPSKFIPLDRRISSEDIKFIKDEKIDIILGCTDSAYTRLVLNMLAESAEIPFIDSGSDVFGCSVYTYIPGKTSCLDCQWSRGAKESYLKEIAEKELRRKEKMKKEGKGCLYEPSLIVPNKIAGSIVTNRVRRLDKEAISITFQSGDGFRTSTPQAKCRKECNPYIALSELEKIKQELNLKGTT